MQQVSVHLDSGGSWEISSELWRAVQFSHCSVVNRNGKTHPKSPQPHLISTNLPSRGAAVLLIISTVMWFMPRPHQNFHPVPASSEIAGIKMLAHHYSRYYSRRWWRMVSELARVISPSAFPKCSLLQVHLWGFRCLKHLCQYLSVSSSAVSIKFDGLLLTMLPCESMMMLILHLLWK